MFEISHWLITLLQVGNVWYPVIHFLLFPVYVVNVSSEVCEVMLSPLGVCLSCYKDWLVVSSIVVVKSLLSQLVVILTVNTFSIRLV